MLSEALQRNAKHEARLSNISAYCYGRSVQKGSEILRFAQNDIAGLFCLPMNIRWHPSQRVAPEIQCRYGASSPVFTLERIYRSSISSGRRALMPVRASGAISHSRPTNLALTDTALLNVERFRRRSVEVRARKVAAIG
jgi:hypothetical protein